MQKPSLHILERVDSTNNYAMAKLREGGAEHGDAWFAREQFSGKGQRGKTWASIAGMNLALSVIIRPGKGFRVNPFLLSAVTATCCRDFFSKMTSHEIKIKWPNDIYWCDRKAGGILIENVYKGVDWLWAVIGIGFNINQTRFDRNIPAVSLKMITGVYVDPVDLAMQLHKELVTQIDGFSEQKAGVVLEHFNASLYKRAETVRLKKGNAVFETTIIRVNDFGQLLTRDVAERSLNVGEVEWLPTGDRSS